MTDDCPCRALPAKGDPKGMSVSSRGVGGLGDVTINVADAPAKRPRRKKTLRGAHCVVSVKTGKPFNCSNDRAKAESLARSLGPRFKLSSKK